MNTFHKKISIFVSLLAMALLFQNCGEQTFESVDSLSGVNPGDPTESSENLIFSFYKGGGHPAPGKENFSYDIKVILKDAGSMVKVDLPNSDCKAHIGLTDGERDNIAKFIDNMKLIDVSESPIVVDRETEYLTIKDEVFFTNITIAPRGSKRIKDGRVISKILRNLADLKERRRIVCSDKAEIRSLRFYVGGGHPAPGVPRVKYDFKIDLIKGVVSSSTNKLCSSQMKISKISIGKLKDLISSTSIKVKPMDLSRIVDFQTSFIKMNYGSEIHKKVHFSDFSAKDKEMYFAKGGSKLKAFLESLVKKNFISRKSLAMQKSDFKKYCASID